MLEKVFASLSFHSLSQQMDIEIFVPTQQYIDITIIIVSVRIYPGCIAYGYLHIVLHPYTFR